MTDHPDRDDLDLFVTDDPSLDAVDRRAIAVHLEGCAHCSREAARLQLFHEEFRQLVRSADEGRPAPRALLFAEIDRHEAAYNLADDFFADLVTRPVDQWTWMLSRYPEQRSTGLARRLFTEVDVEMNRRPKYALQLLAVIEDVIAHTEGIDAAVLSGDLCKQRANAYRHLSMYEESLNQAELAEQFYSTLLVDQYDVAQARLTAALTLFKMTEYQRALLKLATAIPLLRTHGVTVPYIRALILQASIIVEQGDIPTGINIYGQVLVLLERAPDPVEEARILANLGECNLRLGHYQQAADDAQRAIDRYRSRRMEAEAVRSAWTLHLARLRLGAHDALHQLEETAAEFAGLGMLSDAAFVRLDITEEYLRGEQWDEAEPLARTLAEQFTKAGVTLGQVEALDQLRRAVERREATPEYVSALRAYLTLEEPATAFSPPRAN